MTRVVALTSAVCAVAAAQASSGRNVVFIVADDLGFNEMGFQNSTRGLQTPNLDALAADGVILSSYYTTPLCSPSRGSLMTGMYTHRLGLQSNVIYWDTPWAPDANLTFLPQRFKAAGNYTTAMFGKWHLGMYQDRFYPTQRGFDTYAGYLQGCGSASSHISSCCDAPSNPLNFTSFVCTETQPTDYRGYDFFDGEAPDLTVNGTQSTDVIAARAEAFIAAVERPFLLYLPFQCIHAPYDAKWDSYARFLDLNITDAERVMFAYIYELDAAVGRVVAALSARSLMDNTLIVFVSDNGAPPAPGVSYRNYPLQGFKSQTYEGGIRVPAFVHAPWLFAGGRVSNQLVHVTDWTPTLMAYLGQDVEAGLDGVNAWPAIMGNASLRTEIVANINPLCEPSITQMGAPSAALRVGDMKLLCHCYQVAGIGNGTQTGCLPDPKNPSAWPQLYNLTADPGETVNLATQLPQVVAAISKRMAEIALASVEPMQWAPPYQGPKYECAGCPKHPQTGLPYEPWTAWL